MQKVAPVELLILACRPWMHHREVEADVETAAGRGHKQWKAAITDHGNEIQSFPTAIRRPRKQELTPGYGSQYRGDRVPIAHNEVEMDFVGSDLRGLTWKRQVFSAIYNDSLIRLRLLRTRAISLPN